MRKKKSISVSKSAAAKRDREAAASKASGAGQPDLEGAAKASAPIAPADHEPVWVSFDELERYVGLGLTDRRYRQIAKEGFFPDPKNGQYDLWLTIRGLLRHFRELQDKLAKRKQDIADEQHRKLKRENDLEDRLIVKRADVVAEFRQTVQPIRDLMRQKLTQEYPNAVAGMDVPQARIYGQRLEADILTNLQALFDRWKI